jgi:hypothetical protein
VAGTGGVKNAVGEGQADEQPDLTAILAHSLQRPGQRAVKALLLDIDPVHPAGEKPSRRRNRFVGADAERALRVGMAKEMSQHIGNGEDCENDARGGLVHEIILAPDN